MNPIIYGKNPLERIVSIEPQSDICNIYCQELDGSIVSHTVPNSYYILFKHQLSDKMQRLKGSQPFKYLYETTDGIKYYNALKRSYEKQEKFFVIRDHKEAFMVRNGYTYYKGLRPDELTVLAFDLEHSYGIGETPDKDGELLIISMSVRKNGKLMKRLISLDEVENEAQMVKVFSQAVKEIDPSIILSHNLFGHDFPILRHVAEKYGLDIPIGRDGSAIRFNDKTSLFRKDGSQAYDYYNAFVYGRDLVDTYFLALKYDTARNYESYGLKQIIKQEGLEKKGRQHYEIANIRHDWKDPLKRKQIKQYALDDAEDCIKLYDLMATSYFYYTQSVPRSFQAVINSATGSQLNSLMVRAYLQDGHSVAEGDDKEEFEGAISFGNPGIYKNVFKIDLASLYPSIMRQYQIHADHKDPAKYQVQLINYFTEERLKNKRLFKETGNKYYEDLSNSQKIFINSMYGFMGAPKLNYNYPAGAAEVTRHGRHILTQALDWAKEKQFKIVNADTDSISFCKADQKSFAEEECQALLHEINGLMPDLIRWEDDGLFRRVIVVKAKNYILQDMKKNVKIKGSGLKATMKEKALQQYIREVIDLLLTGHKDQLYPHYMRYIEEIKSIKDISRWCSKKTMTKAVMNPERTQEVRINDAASEEDIREGDKFYVFFRTKEEIALEKDFDGVYDKSILFKKLYNTVQVFENVFDTEMFPNYSLKKYENGVIWLKEYGRRRAKESG